MEASERPQLPLDEGPADGSVRALDDRFVIERLEVADARAARLVRDRAAAGRAPAETVRKAIEIGSRVLDSEETAANVDYVRRELEAGLGELDKRLGRTLEESAEVLAEQIAAAFGAERNDSVQAQIKEIVTAETRQQREELLSTLTAEDGSNPLLAIQARLGKAMLEAEERHRAEVERLRESHTKDARAMQGQVAELRKEIARMLEREDADERVAEAEAAGTRKGFTFEERVHEAIEAIATARGDLATHTRRPSTAEGGGKKGDTVVEIGACDGHRPRADRLRGQGQAARPRTRPGPSSTARWTARAASFAVLVVAGDENVPSGREQLTEYEGNKMIVAVDRDEPGRARARGRLPARGGAGGDGARRPISTSTRWRSATPPPRRSTALKQAQAIRSALTGIKTSPTAPGRGSTRWSTRSR